jgi:arylsulfatase A-like enzyme
MDSTPSSHRLIPPARGLLSLILGYLIAWAGSGVAAAQAPRPHIIFILADDLGYGDLSAFGARDIRTTNIDRLAHEGIRFTAHYAAANTCSPSRASLLTGRYPPRTRVNAVLAYDTVEGLPREEITIAEVLREAGYRTAMVGKWHLGQVEAFMPWHQGFEEFFGVATSNDDYNFYLYEAQGTAYRRRPEVIDQRTLTQQFTARALQFIASHAHDTRPFFLYLAPTAVHIPLHPAPAFAGTSQRGTFGDVVLELDAAVGQILAQLQALGIDDHTLVVFSSDNGAWRTMRAHGGSNGVLREGKLTAFDGGHRVPALARWPGHIPPGIEYHQVVTMMDWFPTFAALAGSRVPTDRVLDGKDLQAVLRGTGDREATPFYYFALRPPHETPEHRLAGVREGQWKLKVAQRGYYPHWLEPLMKVGLYHHGDLLFDLVTDPGETTNVIAQHPDIARHLRRLMEDFSRNNPMPAPLRVTALARDATGWEQLWFGIAQAGAVVLLGLALLAWLVIRLVRCLRR